MGASGGVWDGAVAGRRVIPEIPRPKAGRTVRFAVEEGV